MPAARRSLVAVAQLLAVGCLACQPPSADVGAANKEVVRAMYAAIDAQDYDRLDQLVAEDFALHYVGVLEPLGKEAAFELIRTFYGAFPDYEHVVHEMIAEGDRVAVKLTYTGTQQGEFEGIAPTGNRISYEGAQIVTVADGAIKELWALEDMLGSMSQLGMQLVPAEQGT
ncbi:MAG: ester cyclase [Gemmatimonadota bacterium]|nr:MAG: ester cyclase [Gemmatimonadota bacterium]